MELLFIGIMIVMEGCLLFSSPFINLLFVRIMMIAIVVACVLLINITNSKKFIHD